MMIFDPLKAQLHLSTGSELISGLIAGGAVGVISWTLACPVDICKSKQQAGQTNLNLLRCLQEVYRLENGVRAFYCGWTAIATRAFLLNAISLYVWDRTRRWFWEKINQYRTHTSFSSFLATGEGDGSIKDIVLSFHCTQRSVFIRIIHSKGKYWWKFWRRTNGWSRSRLFTWPKLNRFGSFMKCSVSVTRGSHPTQRLNKRGKQMDFFKRNCSA